MTKITAAFPKTESWEYDERRFEREANMDSGSSGKMPDYLTEFIPNPAKLVQNGGHFITEGVIDFIKESVSLVTEIGGQNPSFETEQPTQNRELTIGGQKEVNNFNDPGAVELRAARFRIETLQQTEQNIRQVEDNKLLEDETRDEVNSMTAEQLAKEGDFNNKDVTNKSILKSLANRSWIFFKRIAAKLSFKRQESATNIAETSRAKKSAMQGAFEGASGSQGGGQANLSFQATG